MNYLAALTWMRLLLISILIVAINKWGKCDSLADISILIIIVISMLLGLWRGLVKEAFSLLAWVAAVFIAGFFSAPLADLMINMLEKCDSSQSVGLSNFIYSGYVCRHITRKFYVKIEYGNWA